MYFGYFLQRNAVCWPNRLAAVSNDETLTYAELNVNSNRLANALAKLGLKRGDRLALLMKSSIDWLLAWYACQKLGVAVLPLHVRLLSDELARTVELTKCAGLIYSREYTDHAEHLEETCKSLRFFVRAGDSEPYKSHTSWHELMKEADEHEAQVALDGHEECVLLFTSGTTGVSKGIVRTQQMVCCHAMSLAVGNDGDNEPEVILTPAPLYHTAGLFCIFKTTALAGTLVLINAFDSVAICEQIEKYRATQLLLVPPVSYQRLYQSGKTAGHDLSSVKLALVTAGKCTREYIDDIFEMFPNCSIRPSWGSTEVASATGANLSRSDLKLYPQHIHTVGKINCLVEVRLVDENLRDVPDGTDGEALVRSPMICGGYLGAEKESQKCFADGWFKTEDIMRRDSDGYFYLMDRKRDIVKTGGENVYAQEIERVLQEQPDILDTAVIGVDDPRFDEAIAAAIVLREGHTLTAEAFLDFCKERLPAYKKPRYWAIMDSLPENDIGKVQKNVLRRDAQRLFTKIC